MLWPTTQRAGPVRREGGTLEFRYRGGRRGGQRAAGPTGPRGRAGGLVRAAAERTSRSCSSRSAPGSFPDEPRLGRRWLDNPIFIKHVRSRLRGPPLVSAIVITLVALPLHRLGRIPARRVPERRGVRDPLRPAGRDPGDHGSVPGRHFGRLGAGLGHPRLPPRLAPLAHGADARLLLRGRGPRVPALRLHLPFSFLCVAMGTPDFRGFLQLMIVLVSTSWVLQAALAGQLDSS